MHRATRKRGLDRVAEVACYFSLRRSLPGVST